MDDHAECIDTAIVYIHIPPTNFGYAENVCLTQKPNANQTI